jgi:hypothetical protein
VTIMTNVLYYKTVVIARLFSSIEKQLKIRLTSDAKNVYDTIEQLDQIVFYNYIRRHSSKIHEITRHGILFSGLEWHNIKKLQGSFATIFPRSVHSIYRCPSLLLSNSSSICDCTWTAL